MRTLAFVWRTDSSSLQRVAQEFDQFSIRFDNLQRPLAAVLWCKDGTGIEVCSRTRDIPGGPEVGVLDFQLVDQRHDDELPVIVPIEFDRQFELEKLIVFEGEVIVESGLALRNRRGEEIIFVAGAPPYGLAVRMPWAMPSIAFDPQYPLEKYQRVPMT